MPPTSSWRTMLSRMTRRLKRMQRRLAQRASVDGQDNFQDIFLFGPHG
jgi:hypothetical protein